MDSFHEFEHAGWERAAEHYADAFGGLTTQAGERLLDAVGVLGWAPATPAPLDLLDVATGPGFVAAAAAARGARVIGVDFSSNMIAEARRRHRSVDFREGDAEALSFGEGLFDAVVMNFGLLHLAKPEAALAEAYRVLRPGGRYGFTVWAPPNQAVGFGVVLRAIESYGRHDIQLPEGPPFFRFSELDESRRCLEQCGFQNVSMEQLALTWRLTSPDGVYQALSKGGVRTAALLRAQSVEAQEAIRSAVRHSIEAYARDGGYSIPMPAVLAVGTKRGEGG
jgi:ubiquinone/menaquinone biosynthesis C-methylase UbiE